MDKPRCLWPWIVAVLVGVPVLYVLSFGPACWLALNGRLPPRGYGMSPAQMRFYDPVFWIMHSGPEPVRGALAWYNELWVH